VTLQWGAWGGGGHNRALRTAIARNQSDLESLLSNLLQGVAGVSLQWGAWGGGGMAADALLKARLARVGMGMLRPADGLGALAASLRFAAGMLN